MLRQDGVNWHGDFRDGKREGVGVYNKGESQYSGECKADKFHGIGEYKQSRFTEHFHSGFYEANNKHEFGVETTPGGASFQGIYKDGKRFRGVEGKGRVQTRILEGEKDGPAKKEDAIASPPDFDSRLKAVLDSCAAKKQQAVQQVEAHQADDRQYDCVEPLD